MKKIMEQWGLLHIFSIRTSYRSNAESPSVETSTDSSNDLGERLKNLPIALRQKILCSFSPKERLPLRLVSKAMLHVVDASMSDVQEIDIYFSKFHQRDCSVGIKTINPYNGVPNTHTHEVVLSSLPFLLKWTGAELKTLELSIGDEKSKYEGFHLKALYRVFKALNSRNTCPKLTSMNFTTRKSVWNNNERLFSELLKYVTIRQLQAKAADHPTPFLHSLTLSSLSGSTTSEKSTAKPLHSEKRRKVLQDILDQCHGLKELDVEDLLVQKDLPIVALRYPTTLTKLKSARHNEAPGTLQTIASNCPNLQIVQHCAEFPDDARVRALASLSNLRELILMGCSMDDKIIRMTAQCMAAFEDHPFGASVARPWPQLKLVALCYYKYRSDYERRYLNYRLILNGTNSNITSLDLHSVSCCYDIHYVESQRQLFKALNNENACPHLTELGITLCELFNWIEPSETLKKELQEAFRGMRCARACHPRRNPTLHEYGIFNDLLTYVTKRQSEAQLGKSFLRSLNIGSGHIYVDRDDPLGILPEIHDQMEQSYNPLQQILDQCHGLEDLCIRILRDSDFNPNMKSGSKLMELVTLRFPPTLKKFNDVQLDNITND